MSRKFKLWRYTTIIWSCLCFVHAGPLERSVRIIREVYPEIEPEKVEGSQAQVCIVGDVVYGAGETVPADQSCLKCKCQPPGVHCETTRCEKKPGCRAIHRPNNCCPVYQCECEYEGKTYANGERLDTTSGGECKVCYCRGGEVKCAEVSCYIRTDCEGRTVPGQCCPKYEHCPPIEPTLDKLAIIPDSIEFKSTTEAATRPVIYNTSNATSVENEIIETTPSYYGRNFTGDADASVTEINVNQTERELKKEEEASEEPKITIHEIIPEAKEITETQKEEVQAQAEKATIQGQLLVEEAIPHSHSHSFQKPIVETAANDLGISDDSDLESSEVSEVFQHPPPILRVGDQLLFLKKGEFVSDVGASTPSPVFTIIGAEGLQRGDIDSSEHHETQKETGEFEEAAHFENVRNESAVSSSNEEEEAAAKEKTQLGLEEEEKTNFTEASNAKREITVGQILVEEVTDGDKPQTQNNTEFGNSPTENNVSLENSTIDVAVQLPIVENDTEEPEAKITWFFTTTTTKKSEEEQNPVTAKTYDEDLTGEEEEENTKIRSDEVIPLENPAYPPIPEIMSQQDTDEILEENTDVLPELELSQLKSISEDDEKAQVLLEAISDTNLRILPEILTMRNNHSIPESVTHSEWLKATSSETLVNEEAVLPDSIIQQAVPSDEITTEEEGEDTTTVNEVDKKNATDLPVEDLKSEASSMMYSTIIEDVFKNRSENDKPRSTESLEDARSDEESGENTTPKNSPQQIHLLDSNENASVNDAAYQKDSSAAEKENSGGDVEMIDLHRLQTNATSHVTKRNVTHEEDSSSTARESESDKIFQQLGDEIQLLSTNATMGDDEKKEAQIIFKELFDEVNSTDVPKLERGGVPATARESAILQRVSDAIAKFQLKDAKSLDTSILGILRDFFSSQYKSTYKDN